MRQLLYPPNLLSLARIALAPLAVAAILRYDYEQAVGLFLVAAVSDALDGDNWVTELGTFLDPIADKLLLVAVYVALGVIELVPRWLVAVVLGRDLLILLCSAAILLFTGRRNFRPSLWGKLSTVCQVLAAVAALAGGIFAHGAVRAAAGALVWVAAAATVSSGLDYARLGWRMAVARDARRSP
jgi:cardiolipin synthase